MNRLEAYIAEHELTQKEAAERMGVPQSRISLLVNGRISKFTIDYLLNMCTRVGIAVDVTFDGTRARDSM